MRGHREPSGSLFSYVSIEERIPASHPLRRIRKLANQALDRLNPTFCELYAAEGRPSVPPEQLLLASLLQAFYGIRSERLLLEQLNHNLLFRLFVGLSPDDPIWHPTTFTKNRERLLIEQIMGRFLEKLMGAPEVKPLLSSEHFSVDGTLLQAWASHASLERIDGQDDRPPPPSGPGEGFGAPKPGQKRAKGDFRGIKLSNKTHRSSVDPDALLCRKSNAHPALPCYLGYVLMDNRRALIVDCRVTQAVDTGERDAAKAMAADIPGAHQKILGADKNCDTKGMVAELRWLGVTPHVAQNTSCLGGSAIDGRTTRHEGYARSIHARRGIEKVFGWIKQWGGLRQFKLRGTEKVSAVLGLHVIA
jgi:transposase